MVPTSLEEKGMRHGLGFTLYGDSLRWDRSGIRKPKKDQKLSLRVNP